MRFIQFKRFTAILLLPWLLAILIQSSGRLFLLCHYAPKDLFKQQSADIINMFIIGLRFDTRMATFIFGTLLICSLLTLIQRQLYKIWLNSLPWINTLCLMLVLLLTVINIYYYATYDRHIDLFIYGLFEDDTNAILQTLWNDYPIIRWLLILIVATLICHYLNKYWQQSMMGRFNHKHTIFLQIPTIVGTFLLITIAARGSLTTFPLRHADAQISNIKIINDFTPNAVIAINWAYNDFKNNTFSTVTDEEGQALLTPFFDHPMKASLAPFNTMTATNLIAQDNPPNVVFAVMESFGTHLLQYDAPERDLYGHLRQHWQQDWCFERFVSEGDGTIDSLNRFLVRSPITNVSQSSAQHLNFESNLFKPFINQGYRIVYITPGNGAWRNLNQFLPNLGVNEFIEQNTLKKLYPEAEIGPWGVPDEYMFRFAEKRLTQAKKENQPVFIMMMSISHHPPYKLPKYHTRQNYNITNAERIRLSNLAQGEELVEVFNTFHYANDQLGQFISWVKDPQNLNQNTILAATGDHNIRGINYPEPTEIALHHAVPFYLYVPKIYQNNTFYDPNRIGSHKDIMPTLYNLSLSKTSYYQTGCNIVAPELDKTWCQAGYNPNVFLMPTGAFDANNKTFRSWQKASGLALANNVSKPDAKTKAQIKRWEAFTPLLTWQINRQIQDAESLKQ